MNHIHRLELLHSIPKWSKTGTLIGICFLFFGGFVLARDTLEVVVKEGDNLRALAREHLGDPNLWQEILKANNLELDAEIEPGMTLQIPTGAISRAAKTLEKATEALKKATDSGARLFAEQGMEQAIAAEKEARRHYRAGDWQACVTAARRAVSLADKARKDAMKKRTASGTAVLESRSGNVQSRKVSGTSWKRLELGARLGEREKVRTLSDSSAVIVLADESRLRLDANSQAVIREMKMDQLKNTHSSSVSLVEGDVFAMLGNRSKRTLDLEIPGLKVNSGSENYWVSRRGEETRIANFDEKEITLESEGQEVVLARGQGARVSGTGPVETVELLPAPRPLEPKSESSMYRNKAAFAWREVDGAVSYLLQISEDPNFEKLVFTGSDIKETNAEPQDLPAGALYWRVRAIDTNSFPGNASPPRSFSILEAAGKPFLAVHSPSGNAIIRQSTVLMKGAAQKSGKLTIGGEPVVLDKEGLFQREIALKEGLNQVELRVVDEAGKETRRTFSIIHMPDTELTVAWDQTMIQPEPDHFVTRHDTLTLSGLTLPQVRLETYAGRDVQEAEPLGIGSYSDKEGRFRMVLPVGEEQELLLRLKAVSGQVAVKTFRISRDITPPEIKVLSGPPPVSASSTAVLEISLTDVTRLWLNGKVVENPGEKMKLPLNLQYGSNRIRLQAADTAGNRVIWSRRIIMDDRAPEPGKVKLSGRRLKSGQSLEIRMDAKDDTGLRRRARMILRIGDREVICQLSLEPRTQTYRGMVTAGPKEGGLIRLVEVALEDNLGNRQHWPLD